MMQTPEMSVLPLRDIKLPAEPGFWPLAPGWWVVIVLAALFLLILAVKWFRYAKKKRRWQQINEQLDQIAYDYKTDQDSQKLLTTISTFLRRFVKYQLGQDQATSLAGGNWITYLNHFQGTCSFDAFEKALTEGVFKEDYEYDSDELIQTTRLFIKQLVMKPPNAEQLEVERV